MTSSASKRGIPPTLPPEPSLSLLFVRQDGVVILRILKRIWGMNSHSRSAKLIPFQNGCSQLGAKLNPGKFGLSHTESKGNWHAVNFILEKLGISAKETGLDLGGVQEGKFKAGWGFLVMLYFLHSLAHSTDFDVHFAHPIDDKLAAFLQSEDSITVVELGGYEVRDNMRTGQKENCDEEEQSRHQNDRCSGASPSQARPAARHVSPAMQEKPKSHRRERRSETTQLRGQVDSLTRQVEYLTHEKQFVEARGSTLAREMQYTHAQEGKEARHKHQAQLEAANLAGEAGQARLRRGLSDQLKAVEDALRHEEAAVLSQGSLTCMEPHDMEAEILSLRQLALVQKERIAQLEASQETINRVEEKLEALLAPEALEASGKNKHRQVELDSMVEKALASMVAERELTELEHKRELEVLRLELRQREDELTAEQDEAWEEAAPQQQQGVEKETGTRRLSSPLSRKGARSKSRGAKASPAPVKFHPALPALSLDPAQGFRHVPLATANLV